MELSKTKVLIASDGEITYVLLNGIPVICEEFSFHTDGIDVTADIKNAHLGRKFTKDEFLDFVENELGYKLSAE